MGKDVQTSAECINYSNSRVRGHEQLGFAIWYRLGFKCFIKVRMGLRTGLDESLDEQQSGVSEWSCGRKSTCGYPNGTAYVV